MCIRDRDVSSRILDAIPITLELAVLAITCALAIGIPLGLLIGLIQAYIFVVLAMVYIASGTRARKERNPEVEPEPSGN